MNEDNPTLGGKQDDTSPSATPTDNKVPVTEPVTSEPSGDKDVKTQVAEPDATRTDKPDSGDEPQPQPRGRAAQRIGELIRENKSLRAQMEGTDTDTGDKPLAPETPPLKPLTADTPEYARAKDFLKSLGFAPTDEIKETVKSEIQDMEARMILDSEKSRLERTFDGSDGRPKYDHEKVMQHARATGIYNPEAAYENLFKAELMDWAIKNSQNTGSTFTEKPTSSAAPETGQLTRESLARILATPEGKKWYAANRDKVLAALSKGEL